MKIPAIVKVVFYWGRREQKINNKCNKQVGYIMSECSKYLRKKSKIMGIENTGDS